MADMSVHAELLFASEVPTAQAAELTALFTAFGMEVESRRELPHRGTAELNWLVLAALPLQSFLTGFGTQVIQDTYTCVKRMINRHGKDSSVGQTPVPLVLQDTASGLRIALEADLPAEAYEQLLRLDLNAFHLGPLHYDRYRHAWRSELDEAIDDVAR